MTWYKTGTVSIPNNSATVTGVGTSFLTGAAIGEGIRFLDGRIYEISNIVSDTVITISTNYTGTDITAQTYMIVPTQSYIRSLALSASTLVADYATVKDNAGAGKFAAGTVSVPGVRATSDDNTGLYWSAADTLEQVAGGVSQATTETSGFTARILQIWNTAKTYKNIFSNATTAARTWTFPDKSGTVAMTSDITDGTSAGAFTALVVGPDTDADAVGQLRPTTTNGYAGLFSRSIASYTLGNAVLSWIRSGYVSRLNATAGGNTGLSVNNVDIAVASASGLAVTGAVGSAGSAAYLSVTGYGGAFQAANRFGVDHYGGYARLYSSGSDTSTHGSYAFHVTYSDGGGDVAPLVLSATGVDVTGGLSASGVITNDVQEVYADATWHTKQTWLGANTGYDLSILAQWSSSGVAQKIASRSGGTENSAIRFGYSNTGLAVDVSGSEVGLFSSTGLAVTGALSGSNLYVPNGGGVIGTPDDTNRIYINTSGADYMSFKVGGTDTTTLDANGNLFVGGAQLSSERLSVQTTNATGAFVKNTSAANTVYVAQNADTTGDNIFHGFYTEASPVLRGSIDYNRGGGATRYNTTSDKDLKTRVGPAPQEKSLEILDGTVLEEYFWNDDETKKHQIGPFAQDLYKTFKGAVSVGGWYEEVVPEITERRLVSEAVEAQPASVALGEDGEPLVAAVEAVEAVYETVVIKPEHTVSKYRPWAVDKTAFTFHLVAGYQAQKAQIADLTRRLEALEAT